MNNKPLIPHRDPYYQERKKHNVEPDKKKDQSKKKCREKIDEKEQNV